MIRVCSVIPYHHDIICIQKSQNLAYAVQSNRFTKNIKKSALIYITYFQHLFTPPFSEGTTIISSTKKSDELLLNHRLNYYKVLTIFATYQRMRAKWKSWIVPCQLISYCGFKILLKLRNFRVLNISVASMGV